MCDRVVSEDPFLQYIALINIYVDDSPATLKLNPDCFNTNKMIKKPFTALCADKNILYFNEDSGNVIFSCNEMGILNIDLGNFNFDNNFDEYDPDTIIPIKLLTQHTTFQKRKALKKEINEKLMPVAWHPNRWYMSEDEKMEIDPMFNEEL